MNRIKLAFLVLSVAIVAMLIYTGSAECAWRPAPASGAHSLVSKKATEFTLKNLDGKEVKLSQFKDKFILLNFIGTYSATSQKEVVIIEKLYQKFKENENNKDKTLVVLGITAEKDATKVKAFATKYKVTFPILIEAVQTFKNYKVNQLPTIFYINKDGIIFSVHSGPVTYDEKKMEAEINKILANTPAPKEAGQQVICD